MKANVSAWCKKCFKTLSRKRWFWLFSTLAIATVMLISSWALFYSGFYYIHDYLHAARIAEMARGLVSFGWPVRWSQSFGFGYGMPLFEFYAPLPFVVGGLFFIFGLSILSSMRLIFFLTNLIGAVGAYFLGRNLFFSSEKSEFTKTLSGVILATAFVLAPYRAVNLYVRGALSEAWGMMFFPLILLFGVKYLKSKNYWWWSALTLSMSALFLSHNLSALMFLPISLAFLATYLFLLVRDKEKTQELSCNLKSQFPTFLRLIGAYFGAGLLSAFYIIPAFLEKSYTQVESTITGGYFDYKLHFVALRQFFNSYFGYGGSSWDANDEMSFFLGWGVIFALVLGVTLLSIFFAKRKKRSPNELRQGLFLLVVLFLALFSLLMTHNHSLLIWEALTPLRFLQFPWRWLSSSAMFLAIFSSGVLLLVRKKNNQIIYGFLVFAFMSIPAINFFKPESFLDNPSQYYFSDPARIADELSATLPDYLPTTFSPQLETLPKAIAWSDQVKPSQIEVISNNPQFKSLSVSASHEVELTLAVADYPGWQAYIDGELIKHNQNKDGLITLKIPKGDSLISFKFASTPIRKLSDLVSLLSLSLFALISIITLIKQKKQNEPGK